MALSDRTKKDIEAGLDAAYAIIKHRVLDEMETSDLLAKLGSATNTLGELAKRIKSVLDKQGKDEGGGEDKEEEGDQ